MYYSSKTSKAQITMIKIKEEGKKKNKMAKLDFIQGE